MSPLTYRRLYIDHSAQEIHMENSYSIFPLLSLWAFTGISVWVWWCCPFLCVVQTVCACVYCFLGPNLSLSLFSSGYCGAAANLWCDWNEYISVLKQNWSPTRIYVESSTQILQNQQPPKITTLRRWIKNKGKTDDDACQKNRVKFTHTEPLHLRTEMPKFSCIIVDSWLWLCTTITMRHIQRCDTSTICRNTSNLIRDVGVFIQ